jgi:hypothetical protein
MKKWVHTSISSVRLPHTMSFVLCVSAPLGVLRWEADFLLVDPSSLMPALFFFFLWCWGLNSGPTPWATPPALFCDGLFQVTIKKGRTKELQVAFTGDKWTTWPDWRSETTATTAQAAEGAWRTAQATSATVSSHTHTHTHTQPEKLSIS